ncbi:hypothetical protein [Desulfoluna sp.]|uniref:hypothetical protein n=1 Tax=Desulfoluna sp. TaxID=2045199 RepID=UPI0026265C73|nr:hypothetical protein [Desulfoluna sp.]
MHKIIRLCLIGALHLTCYLWFIPQIILPRFGSTGSKMAVAGVVALSLALVTLMFRKGKKP